jgi:hypothetical protein
MSIGRLLSKMGPTVLTAEERPEWNVAIASIGSSTLSKKFVDTKIEGAVAAGCAVHFVDVRDFMPRNPRKEEQVLHELDGLHPITQRAVLSQEGFAECVTTTLESMIGKTFVSPTKSIIVVMQCTSGGHRAYTSSHCLAETCNAILTDSKTQRAFNAMHFPLAWLSKWDQLEKAWSSVLDWSLTAWAVAPQAGPLLSDKYGYAGAVQRKEAHQSLSDVWHYVHLLNNAESRDDDEPIDATPDKQDDLKVDHIVTSPHTSRQRT